MIVVAGLLADPVIELMCARLNDMSMEYQFFDMSDVQQGSGLQFTTQDFRIDGWLAAGDQRVPIEDIRSVFVRFSDYRSRRFEESLAPALTPEDAELVKGERQAAVIKLFDRIPCLVMNRPRQSNSNHSKLFQQRVARAHGFRTPRTLVTTEPARVTSFVDMCPTGVIVKSLSGVRSKVRRVDRADAGRLELVRNSPTQFQELVPGVDVRVHVAGSRVFATEILCDATDYRYALESGDSLSGRAVDLGPAVEEACVRLTRALDLNLSGIDLRRTPEGEHCCFEVNPAPAFLMYERLSGQPISEAVAELLAAPNGR